MRFVYIISFNILKKKLILKFERERLFLIFQFIHLFEIYQRILHKTHGIRNILKRFMLYVYMYALESIKFIGCFKNEILETRLKNVDNNWKV